MGNAEGMWAGKMPAKSPSLGCIPQGVFHVTPVALCHLAVIRKLPGEQNKGELALRGLAGSRAANVLTPLGERGAHCPQGMCCPGAGGMEVFGLWSMPSGQTAPSV